MRLFTIDANYQVELNKEWIMLIPEFAALLKRDRGTLKKKGVSDEGDYRGDKKLKAKKEFTFIYFDLDFTSPIRDYEEFERREQAMTFATLKESDLDAQVMAAHAVYRELLQKSSPSIGMLEDMKYSLKQLRTYYRSVDLTLTNSKGELVFTMPQYLAAIKGTQPAFDLIEKFEKRVQEELKEQGSIRGQSTLGRKEATTRSEWAEKPDTPVNTQQTSFADIASLLGDDNEEEETE